MKSYFGALLCLGVAACSHDRPAETAYDSSQANAATTTNDPQLTPASSEGAPRARSSVGPATSQHPAPARASSSDVAPAGAAQTPASPNTVDTNRPATNAPASSDVRAANERERAPDNTKVNERDRDGATLTPGDQGNNETDLRITQQIRQAVMGDKSLSFTAKNVKIITANGKVTLRGPVKTEQERSAIEAAARKVAGASQVDNQIEVKP
jgi:hyperosmotically inducible periplasmic protein